MAQQVMRERMSVRELERLVEKSKRPPRKPRAMRDDVPPVHVAHIADMFRKRLGTTVKVTSCKTLANGKKARGIVEIEFYSADDLNRIMDVLGLSEDEDGNNN